MMSSRHITTVVKSLILAGLFAIIPVNGFAKQYFTVSSNSQAQVKRALYVDKAMLDLGFSTKDSKLGMFEETDLDSINSIEIIELEWVGANDPFLKQVSDLIVEKNLNTLSSVINNSKQLTIYGKLEPESEECRDLLIVIKNDYSGPLMILFIEGKMDMTDVIKKFKI